MKLIFIRIGYGIVISCEDLRILVVFLLVVVAAVDALVDGTEPLNALNVSRIYYTLSIIERLPLCGEFVVVVVVGD